MLDKLRTALVLVVIGAISGFLIFLTNNFTEEGIIANRLAKEEGYYLEIFELPDETELDTSIVSIEEDFEEIEIRYKDGDLIGYIYKGSQKNNYGDITVLVGVSLDGTIKNVVISSTTNTPTFVNKIKTEYLGNFVGQSTDSVDYDARTGASYTYGSVSDIVDAAATYYEQNRGDAS